MKTWIVDTGAIVAHLDPDDRDHAASGAAFTGFTGHLITTSAVVGEAMYLVSRVRAPEGPEMLADFFEAAEIQIVESCQIGEIRSAVQLMGVYVDTPMDFADATLILLANSLRETNILTVDRRGFSTYRTATGRKFNLILDQFA